MYLRRRRIFIEFVLVSIREFGYGILILEINIFFFDLDE